MPSLANVLLQSIAYMAEKFPDKWMEKIPYYRAREEELEKEERESQRARKHKRRHSHSHKRSSSRRRSRHFEDEEQSDVSDEGEYDRQDRRRHRSLDGHRQHAEDQAAYRRSYNPADYAPVDRHGYAVQSPVNAPPAMNGSGHGTPPLTAFANGSRPVSTSGPIPGYVPYAHVYNAPFQSQTAPHGHEVRGSPRGSMDRYERRDYPADPRGARYNDARSEGDVVYRRRDDRFD
ncbi:hypothetical protein E4T43_00334 [Aureobasidium subglaciale]|nr:hypothetical protein E4T43_00334 [Aureobasidium subglaciale]